MIPVVEEEARIGTLLADLLGQHQFHEIVVVDGGSQDQTLETARSVAGVVTVTSDRGRAAQMNAGASRATGDILLFLHADAMLPADAEERIRTALDDGDAVAGAFCIRTVADGRSEWLAPFLRLADLRSRYSTLPYGDQALFVRAEVFDEAGGFPSLPILEDLEMSRRLRKLGKIVRVRDEVVVSGRRFTAHPIYFTLLMIFIPLLFRLGVSPSFLAGIYGNPR